MSTKPPPCTGLTPPHSLTYSRFYINGWWCYRHSPRKVRGLPDLEPGPGWPIHRQPPPGATPQGTAPNGAQDEENTTP
ncbi:hypothetical protein [Streptomyces sp. bgisy034]|uniref:hypothetical protein n=1 Tax=Streptomyces sp. bgisy034 TaxID=3413774 RepID=UPI003EB76DAF